LNKEIELAIRVDGNMDEDRIASNQITGELMLGDSTGHPRSPSP
jgi:hypothetical protein